MKKLIAVILLTAGSMFGQVSIGIRIGTPPAPRVVRVRPVAPGPGYLWVDGYWYPQGNHYRWHDGYWTLAPYGWEVYTSARHSLSIIFWRFLLGKTNQHFDHDHRWD